MTDVNDVTRGLDFYEHRADGDDIARLAGDFGDNTRHRTSISTVALSVIMSASG